MFSGATRRSGDRVEEVAENLRRNWGHLLHLVLGYAAEASANRVELRVRGWRVAGQVIPRVDGTNG